ncbi:very short patch repair endonuclease [Paenibacillus thermotolerans]|uniref:very short patch repair endonuclease n=1 Tax=Paenibacillus thermotolerans TaxID=3027807 RepID=UPI0023679360|nr:MULTISPECIES: very short patch repair endonuclease [unclassified Paenibacillus]
MADRVSREVRSKIMAAVRSKRTTLEERISKGLWHRGLRFRKNVKDLIGKPDIAIKKYNVVVFVDSCYWHGCEQHCKMSKSNEQYWINKIERNKQRDEEVTAYYRKNGWHVLRVWEHEMKVDFNGVVDDIAHFIENAKREA